MAGGWGLGAGAIGRVVCNHPIEHGDTVYCFDQSPSPNGTVNIIEVEVCGQKSENWALDRVTKVAPSRIRSMAYCEGVLRPKPFKDLSEYAFSQHLDVNLVAAFRVGQSVTRTMQSSGGAMALITSIHG